MLRPDRFGCLPLLSALTLASITSLTPVPSITSIAQALPTTPPIAPSTDLARTDRNATDLERAILDQINQLRQDPARYADWLETQREYYSVEHDSFVLRLPGEAAIGLYEGVAALDEAIATLRNLDHRPPLGLSPALTYGVQDWVAVMGTRGLRGGADHQGNDQGYYTRNYGRRQGDGFGIDAYQRQSAAAIVLAWVVNDGDPLRSIQTALLDPAFQVIGVGCASHRSRDVMCSISVAEEFIADDPTLAAIATEEPSTDDSTNPATTAAATANTPSRDSVPTPHSTDATVAAPRAATFTTPQTSNSPPPVNHAEPLSPADRLTYNLTNPPPTPEDTARAIFDETNRMRSNPAAYAEELVALLDRYDGNNIDLSEIGFLYETQEGVTPVYEAIDVLRHTDPLPTLTYSTGLEQAARDHVDDLGVVGMVGHVGTDRSLPRERAQRYGTIDDLQGENISYQYDPVHTAQWHVLMLLVDDGVPDRGHRETLLKPDYQVSGVACGYHAGYDNICVMTYADGYTENTEDLGTVGNADRSDPSAQR
ncbi:MAG: hypothetical protein EAZ61_06885 [Oscillatoriales cyanobacterium]|nr:MAG: hypothetical protein EAZ61_06885 [Oscillatoriales cyanobacterium]